MHELALDDLPRILGARPLDLIRRGADGSLRLSTDRWQLLRVGVLAVEFSSIVADSADQVQALEVPLDNLARVTWDRLPKQRARAQVRFHLRDGDLWTFSGRLDEPSSPG
jgi:hypothetical protein